MEPDEEEKNILQRGEPKSPKQLERRLHGEDKINQPGSHMECCSTLNGRQAARGLYKASLCDTT